MKLGESALRGLDGDFPTPLRTQCLLVALVRYYRGIRVSVVIPVQRTHVSTKIQFTGQHGDADVQAKYHIPLSADGGAWLGPAYP